MELKEDTDVSYLYSFAGLFHGKRPQPPQWKSGNPPHVHANIVTDFVYIIHILFRNFPGIFHTLPWPDDVAKRGRRFLGIISIYLDRKERNPVTKIVAVGFAKVFWKNTDMDKVILTQYQ